MESFKINLILNNVNQEILVIPDDCSVQSIFHLVNNGSELCKLLYTDTKSWELIGNADISIEVVEEIGKKIEEHYL
jgi:hypothetical protein